MNKTTKAPRRLIEVALPLDVINAASAREKKIKVGKPTSVHHWFAPRTLTAARAIIFAQMITDPGGDRGWSNRKTKKQADLERQELFSVIRELALWENYNNRELLAKAAALIRNDWEQLQERNGTHDPLPTFLDPFCGRGTIPLEAQNLGLSVIASDLNPIPVLINKGILDFPKRFAGYSPLSSAQSDTLFRNPHDYSLDGLTSDILFYGQEVLANVRNEVGSFYPSVSHDGDKLPVIAWLWARTVRSPNPAFSDCEVPLISSYLLSAKAKAKVSLSPVVSGKKWHFDVVDTVAPQKGTVNRKGATCLLSNTPIPFDYIRAEGRAGRMGRKLIAIVADSGNGRVYLPANKQHEDAGKVAVEPAIPLLDVPIEHWSGCTNCVLYGYESFLSLFTDRQRFTLSVFAKHIGIVKERIEHEAIRADMENPSAYADAIATYLAMALSRVSDWNNSFSRWEPKAQVPQMLFGRHSISMCWNFSEANPIHNATGSFIASVKNVVRALSKNNVSDHIETASVVQHDVTEPFSLGGAPVVISTDPPYYDNIPYANLADFFYVWLRTVLGKTYPELFSTIATPRAMELVANSERHGGKAKAQQFFIDGMKQAVANMLDASSQWFPMTIYYAFKQSETTAKGESSTGWETFLEALIDAGAQITGTWPIRTESNSALKEKWNSLASSVVLVCRRRSTDANSVSRRDFIRELNQVLPGALDDMTRGVGEDQSPVAPVDLSQAIIGPGMAVFSKYSAVLEADGEPMTVRTALQLINRFLAEDDFDKDTQFCLHWFEQYGWDEGLFGEADVLARAKATAVDALADAGVIQSGGGKVKLLRWSEYPTDWDPTSDNRTPVWEALHHLIRGLKQGGESAAGELLSGLQSQAEAARQLAYRLYTLCERKGWAEDAGAYNELITSWSGIETATPKVAQGELF